jgi:hypothetical protein
VQRELVAPERHPQPGLDLEPRHRLRAHRRVEQLAAPAPARLRAIQGGVGVAQQVVGDAVVARVGDAERGRHEHRRARDLERLVEHAGETLGELERLLLVAHAVAQDDELVAAEARDRIRVPHRAREPRRDRLQQLVAGLVAERVVDQLELVEVGDQHRGRRAAAARAGERERQPVGEQLAVRQPGERIVQRAVDRELLARGALDRRAHDVGHDVDERGLLGAPGARLAGEHRDHPGRPVAALDRHADRAAHARAEQLRRGVDVAGREVVDDQRPVGGEHQAGQRARPHGPALALAAPRRLAVHRQVVELRPVDLVDDAGVGAELLGHHLREPLGQLADVGGDQRDPPQLGGRLAVAGTAVERLDRLPAARDVLHLRVGGDRAVAVVAQERDGDLAPHE